MLDTAIVKAVQEKANIESKIAASEAKTRRYKSQLSEINSFISQWEKFSGTSAPIPSGSTPEGMSQNGTDSKPQPIKVQNSKKEEVATAARLVIEGRDVPVSRSELYGILSRQGLQMNGSNPEMVLSTMLWRAGAKEGIVRLKSGGYWLADRAVPGGDGVQPEPDAAIFDAE